MSAYLAPWKRFAKHLEELLGDAQQAKHEHAPWMPLSVERIGATPDGHALIAMSHTGVQNGDLMRDPEVVFELHARDLAEPISYRQDYLGVMREVYTYDDDGAKVGHRPREKADLTRFCSTWFRNLGEQGFLAQ